MLESIACPLARADNLVVTNVADELLVFDVSSNHLHHLEREAASLWQAADGTRSVAELALLLERDATDVEGTLARLSEAGLLATPWHAEIPTSRVDRRKLLRRAGLAMGVVSVSAPLAAQAQSTTCVPFNQCSSASWGQECCNTGLVCAYDMRDSWYACFAPVFCDDPDFWQVQCWPNELAMPNMDTALPVHS